jgi:hypothetical protein
MRAKSRRRSNAFAKPRQERGHPSAATYADWLGDHGLFSADLVLDQMVAWKDIYEEEQPDLVIGEQSPLALLTARAMGIACAAIGTGYTLPPPQLPRYPPYFPENAEPLWSEEQMTGQIATTADPMRSSRARRSESAIGMPTDMMAANFGIGAARDDRAEEPCERLRRGAQDRFSVGAQRLDLHLRSPRERDRLVRGLGEG